MEELQELSGILAALSRISGLTCLWKVTGALMVESRLPQCRNSHLQPFCLAVKGDRERESRCIAHDTGVISRRIAAEGGPLVCRCHAGVAELVIPLFDGDNCMGAVLCGPFRAAGAECEYPVAAEAFRALPERDLEVEEGLCYLVPKILREAALSSYPLTAGELRNGVRDHRILAVMDHLDRHFRKRITIESMAKASCLSPSRLIHLFKQECGISFSEYLLRVRLREARRYLTESDLRMDEVAELTGFPGQSHFAAVFKRAHVITPLNYRKKHRKLRQV